MTSKREGEAMSRDASDEDVQMWGDEYDKPPRRGWFGRRKARAHVACRKYLDKNIPAEDDADENLPVFLRGHRGRLTFAAATLLLLFGWALCIATVVL